MADGKKGARDTTKDQPKDSGDGLGGGNMGAGKSGKEGMGSEKPSDGRGLGSQKPGGSSHS